MMALSRVRPSSRLGLFLTGLLALLPFNDSRADEWFLKVEGIPGVLTNGPHAGWTPVNSAGAIVRRPDPTNPTTGPASFSCVIEKAADGTSPLLMESCGTGRRHPRISLAYVLTSPGATHYRITLENALVSSFSQKAPARLPGTGLSEFITFEFQKLEWACLTVNAAGGTTGGLTALVDTATGEGQLKSRRPFQATLDRRSGQSGVLLTCPVERGHRYRVLSAPTAGGPWRSHLEFTATEDGDSSQFIAMETPSLLLRVEELD